MKIIRRRYYFPFVIGNNSSKWDISQLVLLYDFFYFFFAPNICFSRHMGNEIRFLFFSRDIFKGLALFCHACSTKEFPTILKRTATWRVFARDRKWNNVVACLLRNFNLFTPGLAFYCIIAWHMRRGGGRELLMAGFQFLSPSLHTQQHITRMFKRLALGHFSSAFIEQRQ